MSSVLVIFIALLFGAIALMALISYLRDIMNTGKKIQAVEKRHYTLLRIRVPRNNMKTPLAAEQMFAALHGIYRASDPVQEHFSVEIAATSQAINFYILVPTHLRDFIEGQIYSQYPTVEIEATQDYANVPTEDKALMGADIVLTKSDYYPIRTFTNFDVDPLAGITGVLSKIDEGELLSIQAVLSPIDEGWQKEGVDYVKKIKEGKSVAPPPPLHIELRKMGGTLVKDIARGIVTGLITNGATEAKKEEKKEVKLSGPEEVALKGIEAKVTKLGYAVSLRVLAITNSPALSQTRVESVVGAFKQFNLTNLNGFTLGKLSTDATFLRAFRSRQLNDTPFRFNVEEIASVFHFPDSSVETPSISWAGSKKGEPPQNLPVEGDIPANELTSFGLTSFRNKRAKFGMKALDRRLHFYIIGKTGTGKSTLIENMIYDDIKEGRGVAVVDPHGELIEHILSFIPEDRIADVVYFNPDDRDHPLAFNLLESVEDDMRSVVASGLMSIFTKLWANVWSARMEYILRNAILAVLEVPNSTLLSIMRVLNDPGYRKYVMTCVTDPVVRDFFINEYEKYDAKFRQEAIAPIQNKVGQFLSSATIRNIVGQPHSTFNLAEIMDTGKIFLVDLSVGRIGEDNSKLLGSMIITKIQLAAMARARVTADLRRDFYLYVDEFQNFATDSFATILSEARKYHLNLVLANQYIAQIPEIVSDAIFGNVGTMVSFRVGPTDAEKLVKEFAPVFDANDLVNLPNRQIYVKMAVDGVTSQAFSAHTLPPRGVISNNSEIIIEQSRKRYSRSRDRVEQEINDAALQDYRPSFEQDYEDISKIRPLILNKTVYKEFSSKGGDRWYFGQPNDVLTEEEAEALAKVDPDFKPGTPAPSPEPEESAPVEARVEKVSPPPAPKVPEKKSVPVVEASAWIPPLTTPQELAPAVETALPVVVSESPVTDIVPYHEPGLPAEIGEGSEPRKKRKRNRKRKKNQGSIEGNELSSVSTPTATTPDISENRVGESTPDNPDEVVLASPPIAEVPVINRGQQSDDWMPMEEL